jgi:organic hydroperoxide reductase OsmC/OhrA
MKPLPHHYRVSLANGQLLAPPREPIAAGPPPQFDGSDRVWSPEELLVGAALECLWTTFLAFARHEKLVVHDWTGDGLAVLDRGPRMPVFTSIKLFPTVHVEPGDEDRARRVLLAAAERCIVSNALNVAVEVEPTITTAPVQAAAS